MLEDEDELQEVVVVVECLVVVEDQEVADEEAADEDLVVEDALGKGAAG